MNGKQQSNKYTARSCVRIHDANVLDQVNDITKLLGNRNAAINRCLSVGAPIVYKELFGREPKAAKADEPPLASTASNDEELRKIARYVKQSRDTQDDILVAMSAIMYMTNTLYNVKVAEIEDEEVNADLIESGYFSDTPEVLSGLASNVDKRKLSVSRQRRKLLSERDDE